MLAGRGQQQVHAQIAVGGLLPAQRNGHIRFAHMRRVAVGVGIDGHAADAQPLQGADGADGDFAAVCNQNGIEHDANPLGLAFIGGWRSGWPERRASHQRR